MDERRKSPRMRRLKEGRLLFPDGKTVLTCQVRDVSATGARLKVGEPWLLPHNFTITIPGEIEARPAERMWVRDNEVGIRFKT